MPIKITLDVPKKKAKSFPKIMVSNTYITLFSKSGIGTILAVLDTGAGYKVGDCHANIPMSCYTDHNKPVTLENK